MEGGDTADTYDAEKDLGELARDEIAKPIGRETVDKLQGAMQKFNAEQGLFVAWGGFKSNVQKELASQFFRLRLWTQKELLEQLFEHYERLDEDLKAELPLKRMQVWVWMEASQEEDV